MHCLTELFKERDPRVHAKGMNHPWHERFPSLVDLKSVPAALRRPHKKYVPYCRAYHIWQIASFLSENQSAASTDGA